METNNITGLYEFKSPYHKHKLLPFLVLTPNFVKTVEYRGKQAYRANSEYSDVQSVISACNMTKVCEYSDVQDVYSAKNTDNHICSLVRQLDKAKEKDFC